MVGLKLSLPGRLPGQRISPRRSQPDSPVTLYSLSHIRYPSFNAASTTPRVTLKQSKAYCTNHDHLSHTVPRR